MSKPKSYKAWVGKHRILTILALVIALLLIVGIAVVVSSRNKAKVTANTSEPGSSSGSSIPINADLPNITPPKSQAQSVADYKASAQQVTLADLQKDPNSYNGKVITFTASISKFLQDSTGNTGAMNVDDATDSSAAYINLSAYIDLSRINQDDVIQIWGTGLGSITGQNAFGGDIHVAGVNESYLLDTTSGYSDDTNPNP